MHSNSLLVNRILLTYLLALSLSAILTAQSFLTENTLNLDAPSNMLPARIEDLAWMTGRWTGEGFGGQLEETWNPPLGGAMVATFRLVSGNQPAFYEICLIAPEGNSLMYKVKHFNPDFSAWEEKEEMVRFPLVKIEPGKVWFEGLTLVLEGDVCTQYLAMKQKDGNYKEVKLTFRRTEPDFKQYPGIKMPSDEASLERLRAINRDVWQPFAAAYAAGSADHYMALHTADFIRATKDETKNLPTYRADSQRHFQYNLQNNSRCEIAFSFFERSIGPASASERGTYRYTAIAADGARTHYYGRFHVIHRLENGRWKIAVDYDSDEDGTIGQDDFEAGLPMDIFVKK